MARIHMLDERLIGKIAAGEVVERPASVVKELVENALDAGASDVAVELVAGGKRRIVVADDGCGMDADDALLAFDRHATSKIADFDDLERVATLGFRGEALATIAAVARVELRTAVEPGEGQRVRIEGGRVRSVEPVAHPRGTRIEAASLFWNVPARRKFLKRPETELRRALEVVQGYALAHPEVRFTVEHQGRRLLEALPARGDEALRERIAQVFGAALAGRLVAIPELPPRGDDDDRGDERVRGFVGDPTTARGRRLFVYVNRRLVRDRALLATFYRAVREEWRSEDFPSLFLFLELPAEDVDVNVHPQKAEVRFRDPRLVDRVGEVLRRALGAARGEEPAPLRVPGRPPAVRPAWEGLGGRGVGGAGSGGGGGSAARSELFGDVPDPWRPAPAGDRYGDDAAGDVAGEVRETAAPAYDGDAAGDRDGGIARAAFDPPRERAPIPLSGRSGEARPFRLLGQYKGTLILLEGPDGLWLVDQHVAHERILYERLRRAMAEERTASQALLDPPLLELSPAEAMRLAEMAAPLEECGFVVQPLSGSELALTAVPAGLGTAEAEGLLRELATGDGDPEVEVPALRRRLLDALAASLACRAAIKMHHPLPPRAMEELISELLRAENPYACPHGRPTVLTMDDAELERRFGRR